jgi:predicted Zn-dependent peptidase
MPGIASITAQMLREGTKTRSSKQIAEEADQLGASINASSGFNSAATQFSASGLADNFDQWMELAIDVLMNPSFPQEELSKLRDRQKNQLRQQRTSPQFLASERYSRAVYGGHPAAVVATTAAALDAMTPAALAQWHARYSPQNAILGIVGDVHTAALMPKVRKWFGAWKKSDIKEELPPNPSPAKAFRIYIVDRPGSVQTTLWVGNIAIDRKDPDYIPFSVMNQIIGGGPAGRLFMNLRENKSYTYGYYSSFQALKYPGAWTAAGDVRTEVTEGAMTEVMREIRRIRDEKVPAEELDQRIRAIVASFALSLEQPGSLLNNEIVRKIYNLPKDYWDRYPAMVSAVSAEDVQRMAQKYLSPDALQVVAVGDAGKIKAWFEKFGPVEVWGSDGKPKAAAEGGK